MADRATGTSMADLDPVLQAPEHPLWKVTWGDREWAFATIAEAKAFVFGLNMGRTLVELGIKRTAAEIEATRS